MRAYDLIKRKRDGHALSSDEIYFFLNGFTRGEIPDYQMSALLMAVFWRGLDAHELQAWTNTMLHSGTVLDLGDVAGIKVDKHSTGGVGDKISIALAPLVAACGVRVPMISGRGLGHTGGTLDKLEAIPGFRVDVPTQRFRELIRDPGLGMIGQTADLAPTDRRLYALRDVTATVDSIPLIASSILSKKLAEGIDGLVLDVKFGAGAFMKTLPAARQLAETMTGIAKGMGKRCVALLTDMHQPLGEAVGNALETIECIECLKGNGPQDILELTLALGVEMLLMAERARDAEDARQILLGAIADGSALAKMRAMIAAQGGDPRVIDDYSRFPGASRTIEFLSPTDGVVAALDAERVGLAAIRLGAGRDQVESAIDHGVGILLRHKVGAHVRRGECLATLHVNADRGLDDARRLLTEAYQFAATGVAPAPIVADRVG